MPWLILVLALILAANAAPAGAIGDLDPVWVGYVVGFIAGALTLPLGVWSWGWNAHVEKQRDEAIKRAEETAKKERR